MPTIITGTIGNPPITDATATVSDVANGKVFYNNDGKCIGNGNVLKQITFTVKGTGSYDEYSTSYEGNALGIRYNSTEENVRFISQISYGTITGAMPCGTIPSDCNYIRYVKVNKIFFPVPTNYSKKYRCGMMVYSYMNHTDDLDFYISANGKVGLCNANNQSFPMTVFYD